MHAPDSLIRRSRRGYSLLEVLIALAILTVGIVGILAFFPAALRASQEAALRSQAALLAQMKAEELRRDADADGLLVAAIASLEEPSDPMVFPLDNRLTYQYHSRSLRVPDGDPLDPEFTINVPRVIVRYNPAYNGRDDVLFELRFDYNL